MTIKLRPYQKEYIDQLMTGGHQFGKTEEMRIVIAKERLAGRTIVPMRNTADLTVAFGKLGDAVACADKSISQFRSAFDSHFTELNHGRRFMVFTFPEPTGKKKHYLRRQSKRVQRQMSEALFYDNM